MILTRSQKTEELVDFLKRDYANNLYFFNYLDELSRPDAEAVVLAARENDAVALALLISPTHCCISTGNVRLIDAIADQIPPVESVHVLGRSDLTLKLLGVVRGPARKQKFYSFCKLNPAHLPPLKNPYSRKASPADLPVLLYLYKKSNILANHETRLPSILASGTVYFAKQGNDAVSCALTTTEMPEMAMIGGIFTDEVHRNRGFARDCTVNLCRDLAARQKEVYLFYEAGDPLLTRMYRNIGFEETGTWVVATQR
ncbi:MAG: GNAT family N-acetyltransferase [Thermoanaerobacteraceae bacterium]|jgi:hypothetical protein|nr:GNAT family N-acetyltransferase [Thermoanaerobacteraceae bacterium]